MTDQDPDAVAAGQTDDEPVVVEESPLPPEPENREGLLKLDEAVARVPESLRKEMAELLRADFREVKRWIPRNN